MLWCTGQDERALDVSVLDTAGRLRGESQRVSGVHLNGLSIYFHQRLALEQQVHFFLTVFAVVVFLSSHPGSYSRTLTPNVHNRRGVSKEVQAVPDRFDGLVIYLGLYHMIPIGSERK